MDAQFIVRDIRPEEVAAARVLTLAAYDQYSALMEPSAWAALRRALESALATSGPLAHLVAERNGALLGSVLLFPAANGDTGSAGGRMIWPELRLLAVAPAARGHGVGTALVNACIERARSSGAPALGLYSSDTMQSAIRLYEGLGFLRAPQFDFQPTGAEIVKAFYLPLT
jgi:GNAT superfamily N-acetyltransferase